ncbi:LAFA_0G21110g1_1 [Lachancea sp. 'fantastica']|nr:LAFA_0G21110g1_1 [Lachancea sp. 'fantastica']
MTETPTNFISENSLKQNEPKNAHVYLSEIPDGNDSIDLDYDLDDETFELPLKARSKSEQSGNFSDLAPVGSIDKKVRFQSQTVSPWDPLTSDSIEVLDTHYLGAPGAPKTPSGNLGRKPHIEDVLQHAQMLNGYLDQNLGKIKSFQTDFYNQDHESSFPMSSNFASNVATAPTTPSGSVSNFQLSESEASEASEASDAPEDPHSDFDAVSSAVLQSDNEREDRKIKQILSKHQTATYPRSENPSNVSLVKGVSNTCVGTVRPDSPCTSLGSPANGVQTIQNSPVIRDENFLRPPRLVPRPSETDEEPDADPPDMDSDVALALYIKTIKCLIEYSKDIDITPEHIEPSFATFHMKSAPTLGYEEYLQRFHGKFSFSSVVYLTAAHLLQTLVLRKDAFSNQLLFRFKIESRQVHRLIIATVRLATKLLEDCVHSHTYFSRICGISKKLLTRLEVALLECLKFQALKITNKTLLHAVQIHEELCKLRE